MSPLKEQIRIHGHRGWRGRYPENTIIGFSEVLKTGVDAIELDIVISQDHSLLVAHEPWMNHALYLKPDGSDITEDEGKAINFRQLGAAEIVRYIAGAKPHPRFPDQQRFATHIPTFDELSLSLKTILDEKDQSQIFWNIELKSEAHLYGSMQPYPEELAEIAYHALSRTGVLRNAMIQSFDAAVLRSLHALDNTLNLVFLNEKPEFDPRKIEDVLSFIPFGYSPFFKLANEEVMELCRLKGMQLITWTVNEEEDIRAMIDLGVDAIISDYPERVMKMLGRTI